MVPLEGPDQFLLTLQTKPSVLSLFASSFVPLALSPHFTTVALYLAPQVFHSDLVPLSQLPLECSEGIFNMLGFCLFVFLTVAHM